MIASKIHWFNIIYFLIPTQLNVPSKYCNQSSATRTLWDECSSSSFAARISGQVFLESEKELSPESAPGWNLMSAFSEIAVKNLKVLNKSINVYKSYTHLFKGK